MKPILILLLLTTYVLADGIIFLKFKEYRNPDGTGNNGHCCDGKSIFCQINGCDYKFELCFDEIDSDNSTTNCTYKVTTSSITNQDNVVFDDSMLGIDNPLAIPFGKEIQSFALKITVDDDDFGWFADDHVDFLRYDFYPTLSDISTTIQGRTAMDIDIVIDCEKNCDVNPQSKSLPLKDEEVEDKGITDCNDLAKNGLSESGLSDITIMGKREAAYCVVDEDGNAWTLIQRNVNSENSFNKLWKDYKIGFGSPKKESNFWIGLENMHQLTANKKYKLRIRMGIATGGVKHAEYGLFMIGDEDSGYQLTVGNYSGDAGDALTVSTRRVPAHSGMSFTTKDRDNDLYGGNCASYYQSGWWYQNCAFANLNGKYKEFVSVNRANCQDARCIRWDTIRYPKKTSLTFSEMMILPVEE